MKFEVHQIFLICWDLLKTFDQEGNGDDIIRHWPRYIHVVGENMILSWLKVTEKVWQLSNLWIE